MLATLDSSKREFDPGTLYFTFKRLYIKYSVARKIHAPSIRQFGQPLNR